MELRKIFAILAIILVSACTSQDTYKSEGEKLDDKLIKWRVELALRDVPEGKAVAVSIDRGIVQLSGFVATEAARDAAVKQVSAVKGVADVVDHIIVRNSPFYKEERAVAATVTATR